MMKVRKVKVFKNGGSKAIRIPAGMGFDFDQEVYIRETRDGSGVIITHKPEMDPLQLLALEMLEETEQPEYRESMTDNEASEC